MDIENNSVAFENQAVRRIFDETEEKWYFSVIDVVSVLTSSANPRDYWFKMKTRVKSEDGIELSTICRQLKLASADGKNRPPIAPLWKPSCVSYSPYHRLKLSLSNNGLPKWAMSAFRT